ncbi:type II CAAX endopeptidase family protein [Curtobacterium sp. MCLR17_007]|uniref:CPBP family intramembrane glutamic endopeptidase n=1 Tax=Curtobacterium sp. MCLR17_007 TaxID=2175648 RepID=UPI000DA85308|nr:type II CAAX endopeptidase family protein [Curtobacterium sp. MCLR17_007]WIB60204.1 type II CAAX endopeptidase family protein [Curtobacterium sp. MCLR17_007]
MPTTHTSPHTGSNVARPSRVTWADFGIAAAATVALYAIGITLYRLVPDGDALSRGLALYAVSGLAPLGGTVIAIALRRRDRRLFGLRRVAPKWLLVAFVIGLGVVALNVAISSIVAAATPAQDVQTDYRSAATSGVLGFLAAILLGAVLTPIGEEFFFRGVVHNLLTRYGAWVATLVSAAVFGLTHGVNLATPVAFIVGVSAALLIRRTGSVWPGVVVHAVNNASSSVISVIAFQFAS